MHQRAPMQLEESLAADTKKDVLHCRHKPETPQTMRSSASMHARLRAATRIMGCGRRCVKSGVGAAPTTPNLCYASSAAADIHRRRTFKPCRANSPFLVVHPSTASAYLSSMLTAYAAPRRARAVGYLSLDGHVRRRQSHRRFVMCVCTFLCFMPALATASVQRSKRRVCLRVLLFMCAYPGASSSCVAGRSSADTHGADSAQRRAHARLVW